MVDANKYRMTALAKKGTATTNAQVAKANAPSPVMGRGVIVDKAGPGNTRAGAPTGSKRKDTRYKGVTKGLPSNASPKAMEARLKAAKLGNKKGFIRVAKSK